MNDPAEPRLDAPGAGLPAFERWISALAVRGLSRYASRDGTTRLFVAEAEKALDLARGLPAAEASRPVLIRRVRGMEDSSRNWSVFMALEHLAIVNAAIATLILRLCIGRETTGAVRIEDVKPRREAGPEQIAELEAVIARYGEVVAEHGDLRTAKRYPHPWFGPLTARQWHALSAMHNRIHRIQIERIIQTLRGR
jgi:hypothetical protein